MAQKKSNVRRKILALVIVASASIGLIAISDDAGTKSLLMVVAGASVALLYAVRCENCGIMALRKKDADDGAVIFWDAILLWPKKKCPRCGIERH